MTKKIKTLLCPIQLYQFAEGLNLSARYEKSLQKVTGEASFPGREKLTGNARVSGRKK